MIIENVMNCENYKYPIETSPVLQYDLQMDK